jgi:dTDP-L-rhamnose 4-epimerase
MRGDVRRPRDLANALDGIEVVFHFAARTGVGQSQYEVSRYVDTNVGGTAALLQAILGQKNRVKKLVLASSRAVYGEGVARCPRHGQGHPAPRVRGDLERGDFQIKCGHCGRPMRPVSTAEDDSNHYRKYSVALRG